MFDIDDEMDEIDREYIERVTMARRLKPPGDFEKDHNREMALLYALVRTKGRPTWNRLHKNERAWWLDILPNEQSQYIGDEWHGTEIDYARLIRKRADLEAAGHKFVLVPACVTAFERKYDSVVIASHCDPSCRACFAEASRLADEWVAETPEYPVTIHETTLGRFDLGLADYSVATPNQAIDAALRGATDFDLDPDEFLRWGLKPPKKKKKKKKIGKGKRK